MLVVDPAVPGGVRAKLLDFGIAEVAPEADCRSIFPLDREVLATQGVTDRKATAGDGMARAAHRPLANRSSVRQWEGAAAIAQDIMSMLT